MCLPLMYPTLGIGPATHACTLRWESNRQVTLCFAGSAQSTELPQLGFFIFLYGICKYFLLALANIVILKQCVSVIRSL